MKVTTFAVISTLIGTSGLALAGNGDERWGDQSEKEKKTKAEKKSTGELDAKLVGTGGGAMFLETDEGAILEFEVESFTRLNGKAANAEKTIAALDELKKGSDITVKFRVDITSTSIENIATDISTK
jgi:hypothetical protein